MPEARGWDEEVPKGVPHATEWIAAGFPTRVTGGSEPQAAAHPKIFCTRQTGDTGLLPHETGGWCHPFSHVGIHVDHKKRVDLGVLKGADHDGLVSKRHSKWFRWIEKGKCSIRRDAFKMVLAHQAQSIPRGRFRGGRPPRRCRSYSNHVGNHTPPARRSSSPFASAEHTFAAKESCCEWTFCDFGGVKNAKKISTP